MFSLALDNCTSVQLALFCAVIGSYHSESLGILGVASPPSKTSLVEHNSKCTRQVCNCIFLFTLA